MRELFDKYRPDVADAIELPQGKTVVTFRQDDPYNCHTFHDKAWIKRNWGRYFDILSIRPRFNGLQSLVVCMKP
jgi:hypothetical protein